MGRRTIIQNNETRFASQMTKTSGAGAAKADILLISATASGYVNRK
jgi:hypothetical protein